ncbi:MAG TPA: HAMP domain-containing sensor histidine kinase [Anaerolineales bacterium]|nr:HAMP domain-containing sensor histidine kinase [Anaerolineales bacterium]
MTSYERRLSLRDYQYRRPEVRLPETPEAPENIAGQTHAPFDDLQRSNVQLREHINALSTRNKELEDYAHMVAHDLKEPLTVLILTADLIKDVPDLTGEELSEWLLQIRSTAYEMKSIVKNLLFFAEVSKVEAPRGSVHMSQVVANVKSRLSHMIQEKQAQLILPEVWPDAFGYGPWIEEVWANFLSNALKYGGRPPRVELGASTSPGGMLRFWMRDNGPGIPPEARTRLFIRSNQINRINTLGHGLGLSIVGTIIKKLGGQVGVESEVGKGSLFFFTLPAGISSTE